MSRTSSDKETGNKKPVAAGLRGREREQVSFALDVYSSKSRTEMQLAADEKPALQPALFVYNPPAHERNLTLAEAAAAVETAQDDDQWINAYMTWLEIFEREVISNGQI